MLGSGLPFSRPFCLSVSLPSPCSVARTSCGKRNSRQLVVSCSPMLIPSIGNGLALRVGGSLLGVVAVVLQPQRNLPSLAMWTRLAPLSSVFLCATGLTSFRGCSVGSCGTVWRVLRTTKPFFIFFFVYIPLIPDLCAWHSSCRHSNPWFNEFDAAQQRFIQVPKSILESFSLTLRENLFNATFDSRSLHNNN